MTVKQIVIKSVYPILAFFNKIREKNMNPLHSDTKAIVSFYDLKMKQNNGKEIFFSDLKNKKVIIVNTASACGYTPQYDGLQKLYESNLNKLVILGFPANDFGEQERGDDSQIDQFCKVNFGVTFPLMTKSKVVKDDDQNEVFKWLTDKTRNGWNDKPPSWNFCKYIIDEKGNLTDIFEATMDPADKRFLDAVK